MVLGAGPASRRQKEALAARGRGQGQTRHEVLPQQATPPHAGPFSDAPRCLEWAYACVSLHSFFYFTCHVRSCSIFRVGLKKNGVIGTITFLSYSATVTLRKHDLGLTAGQTLKEPSIDSRQLAIFI